MAWCIRFASKALLIFLLCLFLLHGSSLWADEASSSWLADEPPVLKNLEEDVPLTKVPSHVDGGQECIVKLNFVTLPHKVLPPQSEQSFTSCGVDTPFGVIARSNAYLVRTGTNLAGQIYDSSGNKYKPAPIPNSDTLITYDTSAPSGVYITLQRNVTSRLQTQVDPVTGSVRHILNNSPGDSQLVKNALSQPIDVRIDTANFSGNGEWGVFDNSYVGVTRLNVATGKTLIFAPGYRYDIGLDPSLSLAISSDGRYAIVSSYTYSTFRIYDLDTCVESSSPNTPARCDYRDLNSVLKSKMPEYLGSPAYISFTDDYTIKFYGTTLKNGVKTRYSQLLTASGHSPVLFPYLALGDSFASGEGAQDYEPGTDISSPKNKCHISINSYVYLIGKDLGLNGYESIACSGGKIKDINGQFLDDYSNNKNGRQSTGKENSDFDAGIYNNFLPGYRMQKDFVGQYKPDKITISVSGNDMGFGSVIKNCVFWADNCYSQPIERAVLVKTINDRFSELVKMYGQLKEASPATTIYAVGYPSLVKPGGNCGLNVHAGRQELEFFDSLVTYINSVIKKAADESGVFYVDVADALIGHRLCENTNPEIAVNGLVAGNDKLFDIGPIGNESYHPNRMGQALLKQTILSKTDNFTAKNPLPTEVSPPTISDGKDFIKSTSYDLLDTYYFDKQDMLLDNLWMKEQTQPLSADGFAPNSNVSITLTSDPVSLGSFTAGNTGSLSSNLSLPDFTPVGYHTLHVSGKNIAGEKIEYQEQVFVANSENDYDGDGVVNGQDLCLAIEPSGIDYDQDGVDDACDGQINEPTTPPMVDNTPGGPALFQEEPSAEEPTDNNSPPDNTLPEDPTNTTQDNSTDTGIIGAVDNQNQNTQPQQGGGGLQTQTNALPIAPQASGLQGQGASAILFGETSGSGSLLNQSQVLGVTASPSVTTQPPSPATEQKHSSTPVGLIVVGLILLLIVSWFFRQKSPINRED